MSNCMGVSGATRASNERAERAGEISDPTELMLLARPLLGLGEGGKEGEFYFTSRNIFLYLYCLAFFIKTNAFLHRDTGHSPGQFTHDLA